MNNLRRSIVLKRRPRGLPALQDFLLETDAVPRARCGRGADAHALAVARPGDASPDERDQDICGTG
jgi:hypothetical protein